VRLPSEPLQTKHPPLRPLLLAIIWKINPHFTRIRRPAVGCNHLDGAFSTAAGPRNLGSGNKSGGRVLRAFSVLARPRAPGQQTAGMTAYHWFVFHDDS
jgi:hypothetical protein